jgi:assimilatory nitrate reductase catalytic subunit
MITADSTTTSRAGDQKPRLPQLRQWDGALTRDLVLHPGRFGLGRVPARLAPNATTNMVCGYCSTGCGLTIHLRDGQAVNLTPATDYPVNLGMACPKGWEALAPLEATDRATTPLLRGRNGRLEPVGWDTAITEFTRRFKAIQKEHGPEAVAFLSTGQIVIEEMALLGAVAKFGMGMLHGDANTRQCMATAATAYKQSFGFDAPPYTYDDFEESDVLVFIGANPCIAHPILWQRVLRNRHRPQIIVIDPRKTETAMAATQHCAIRPKSDLTLFYGLAGMFARRGWLDERFIREHTANFEAFSEHARAFNETDVAAVCGITPAQLSSLAEIIHQGRRVSFWWTMGVNQSHEGTRLAQAIINLALMTGNIGRPGTGANSITGQCNAMGSRLYSNTTNLLGGHDFLDPAHRAKIAGLLDLPVESVPDQNSWAYDQILDGVRDGRIRGLWIIGTNPGHSWIDQPRFRGVREKLDFLVVQDMYATTETARIADLVLPAAGWGEKEGVLINSERRLGLVKKVARAPGLALSDFNIFRLVAEAWGCSGMFERWSTPERVFQIIKQTSRGQPCDITGIRDYAMLDDAGGIQWPFPEGAALEPRGRRLFSDGRFHHPDGRAKFLYESPRPMEEVPDADYPFLLMTGRGSSAQWHTGTRTAKSSVLRQLYPETVYIEISPADASRMKVKANQWVRIRSRRGAVRARAFLTHAVQPGQLFMPMHYEEANQLTPSSFDPYSRQPSYKACAVALEQE